MKKNKLFAGLLLFLALASLLSAMPVMAAEPYQTYTYSADGFALLSPAAYSPYKQVDSSTMGLTEAGEYTMDNVKDLFVDSANKVYVVDRPKDYTNGRVVVLDANYNLDFVIDEFVNDQGVQDCFNEAGGVFVNDTYIYVCDTKNERIVMFDREGEFVKIIPKPQSALFGENAVYWPKAMAVDQYGRIFVVSDTTGEGIIVMDDNGTFNGFIGAQAVNYDLFSIIWRRFQTEEQRKRSVNYVPTPYLNIAIDSEGFIYAIAQIDSESSQIAAIESKSASYSPVKKLNSAGSEILKRNGFFDPSGEVDILTSSKGTDAPTGASTIVDVGIGPEGTWSIADQKRQKVFTYDANGNLLFAFGDKGNQLGNLTKLTAVVYQGDYLLLLDDAAVDSFTVYERTEYGDLLIEALACENNREYARAIECWKSVLQRNNNFDTAYIGIGKALYRESKYEESMEYLKAAYETEYYSKAYAETRKQWIASYFIWIPIVLIVICVAWSYFMKYAKRVNYATAHSRAPRTYKQELLYSFHLMYHPFDGFWDLKHEKRGSMRAALTILAIAILAFFYQSVGTGYLLNPRETYSTIFAQMLTVVVPLLLWAVSNWCLTTLFDGEGSLKDITIACCYSLSPLPVLLIVSTICSNVVTSEESQIVSLLVVLGYIWVGFLLFFGMMVTHDYSLYKSILTTLGTIVAMMVIMFVALLFTSLLGKILSFVTSIYTELSYRV